MKILFFLMTFIVVAFNYNCVYAQDVRIRVLSSQQNIEVTSADTLDILNYTTGQKILYGILRQGYNFEADSSGITMFVPEGDMLFLTFFLPNEILIKPENPGSIIFLNKKEYRGAVLLRKRSAKDSNFVGEGLSLDGINVLDLEDYLRGTIRCEISPLWPKEAIKAHIVAARTYAMFQMQARKNEIFDMESDVSSQVYQGCSGEDTSSDQLILETSGEYLIYKGGVINAFYHSCCGGYTEDASNVWGISRSYLSGVRCSFCKDSPNFYWEKKIQAKQIQSALKKYYSDVGEIKEISVLEKDKTDRVLFLEILHSNGRLRLSGVNFRAYIGYVQMPSTLFLVQKKDAESFLFYGRGWGHGVGMCQWGAKGMAQAGYSYFEILKYYYPGTEIKK